MALLLSSSPARANSRPTKRHPFTTTARYKQKGGCHAASFISFRFPRNHLFQCHIQRLRQRGLPKTCRRCLIRAVIDRNDCGDTRHDDRGCSETCQVCPSRTRIEAGKCPVVPLVLDIIQAWLSQPRVPGILDQKRC